MTVVTCEMKRWHNFKIISK